MTFKPSKYQQALFDWVVNGTGHAIVEAVAGSGKSVSAVACMKLIDPTKRVLFLAFNKSISDELREKAPRHADVMTLNSLGHRAWGRFAGKVNLNTDKTKSVMVESLTEFENRRYGSAIRRLVSICKAHGLVPSTVRGAKTLMEDRDDNFLNLMDHFEIDLGENATDEDQMNVINLTRRILVLSCECRQLIDFDDQLYLTAAFGAPVPKYDWVFVDEGQDLSPVQHKLVEMAIDPNGGRIVMVGDSRQACYGFRGADSRSMANFTERMKATRLDLSICYRCPKSHIALAQSIVPKIEAAEAAIEGEIVEHGKDWKASMFTNDDLVICRNSAPLVRAAYKILSQKVAVRILGRDLGAGLVNLIKRLKARSLEDLVTKMGKWRDKEVEALKKKDADANTDKVEDRYETVITFIDMFPDHTPEKLCKEIDALYTDNAKGILTLASCHKSKGLEANRVFILNSDLMPSRRAKKPWQIEQERNLQYVAWTRAKHYLGFIEIESKRRK